MTTTATPSDWAIDVRAVEKYYKRSFGRRGVHALRGVDMRVARGEVFGLLGPNGAGKSTLVKVLMTVITPTQAQGSVLGQPVGHKPTLARIGYLPEHHRFPDYLTGAQVVEFAAAMCGVDKPTRKARVPQLLDLVGMSAWANKPVGGYSKGMRQRVGIAQALANDPELVVLDEPTDGVDPVGRRDIREMLLRIKQQGKTVFLNSHLLSELEMICDRVSIMVRGTVSSQGTIDELTVAQRRYEIEIDAPSPAEARTTLLAALGSMVASPLPAGTAPAPVGSTTDPFAQAGELAGGMAFAIDTATGTLRVRSETAQRVQPVLDALRAHRCTIRAVRPVRPSLEDLFMQAVLDPATGNAYRPGAAEM